MPGAVVRDRRRVPRVPGARLILGWRSDSSCDTRGGVAELLVLVGGRQVPDAPARRRPTVRPILRRLWQTLLTCRRLCHEIWILFLEASATVCPPSEK